MITIEQTTRPVPTVVPRDEGRHHHFLNHLATVKASGTDGALSAVEFVAPRGFGPPLHRHLDEDELVVVLEGEMVFRSGDDELVGREGAVAVLPRGVPHTFQVLSPTARFLSVTASGSGHPRFDRMVAALGTPTDEARLPEPGPIDPAEVARVNAAHGIEILGPPPAPLDEEDAR
jgi:uncharacterized cupin superfamily protein